MHKILLKKERKKMRERERERERGADRQTDRQTEKDPNGLMNSNGKVLPFV